MGTYAIIETGGKQLRVEPNQLIAIERVKAAKTKKEVSLDKVLAVQKGEALEVGNPYVRGAKVVCEFLAEKKDSKKIIFKMRRRKNYRRKNGHRQIISELRVKEIHLQA